MHLSSKEITVIIVADNDQSNINSTLQSIANQSVFNKIESIVVALSSTDQNLRILDKYKVDVLIENKYKAINEAIKRASGQWLTFLLPGNVYKDHKVVEKVLDKIDETKDIFYGSVLPERELLNEENRLAIDTEIYNCKPFEMQTAFFKKKLFEKYSFDCSYLLEADYDLIVRCYKAGLKFEYLDIDILTVKKEKTFRSYIEQLHILSKHFGETVAYNSKTFKPIYNDGVVTQNITIKSQQELLFSRDQELQDIYITNVYRLGRIFKYISSFFIRA